MWHLLTQTSGLPTASTITARSTRCTARPGIEWGTPPGLRPRRLLRAVGGAAAAVPARQRVELRRLHRRARPRRRGDLRPAARRVPRRPRARAARHGRHRFFAAEPDHGRLAALYVPRPGDRPRDPQPRLRAREAPARHAVGRRRAGLDRRRLRALHAHARARRRARRRAPARPAHAAADDANQLPGHADLEAFGRPLFAETTFDGVGFGLGFSVVEDPVAARYPSSRGEFGWGGAASTAFWVDPRRAHGGAVLHAAAAVEHAPDPLPAAPAGAPGARSTRRSRRAARGCGRAAARGRPAPRCARAPATIRSERQSTASMSSEEESISAWWSSTGPSTSVIRRSSGSFETGSRMRSSQKRRISGPPRGRARPAARAG